MAPYIEGSIRDEPDVGEATADAIYDYAIGRLGSDQTLRVRGSDDSTEQRITVSTDIAVSLIEHPAVIGSMVVYAKFECQEVVPEIVNEAEEYGPSDASFSFSSQPYAYIMDQAHGHPDPVLPLFKTHASGEDGLLSDGEIAYDHNFAMLPTAGEPIEVKFTFRDVVATAVPRLVVGIANELKVYSNDWEYKIRFRSHWILTELRIGMA